METRLWTSISQINIWKKFFANTLRENAKSTHEATIKAAAQSFNATKDNIVNFSDNGITDTITDFATELEENKEEIGEKISENKAAHEEKIEVILTTLGTGSDFAANYGAELPAYSADDYSA